jgi:hypothetical protein
MFIMSTYALSYLSLVALALIAIELSIWQCNLVPCHRVIGADGELTGFADGPWTKEYLIALQLNAIEAAARGRLKGFPR